MKWVEDALHGAPAPTDDLTSSQTRSSLRRLMGIRHNNQPSQHNLADSISSNLNIYNFSFFNLINNFGCRQFVRRSFREKGMEVIIALRCSARQTVRRVEVLDKWSHHIPIQFKSPA